MNLLESIREIFKTLKHRKPSRIYCPKCGSPKISLTSNFDYRTTPNRYNCEACGYAGSLFMELEKEKE